MTKKYYITYYLITPLLLILGALAFYLPSMHYAFQFDDLANIVNNFQVRVADISELFLANTRWISQTLNTFYYQVGKFNPFVYRLANITAHILAGTSLYFIVCLALRKLRPESFLYTHCYTVATLTAGLFLLHPVQTQTVSYIIQGQLEGLATLTTLLMVLSFLLYTSAHSLFGRIFSLLALYTCMLLAPGTKEIAIISPLLVLLVDWFFVAQGHISSLKKRWWVHTLLFVGIFGMYIYFLKPEYFTTILGLKMELQNNMGNMLTDTRNERITALWYFISQFKVILHYIAIFIWPFNISVDYDWMLVNSFFSWDCIIPFIILVTLGAYTLYRLHKNRIDPLSFAILWFFIAILPRSSIIPSTELVADYKTYLASCGIFFLGGWALATAISLLEKRFNITRPWVHALLIAAILIPCGYALYERNKVWRTGEEFWFNILKNAPGKARAYNNYGVSLCDKGKAEQAIPHFQKAISMDKTYSDPHNNLAVAYGAIGKVDEAIQALENSIRIFPLQPEAYNNMASFYLQKNEFDRSEELLRIALRLRPHYGKAHFNLGRMYLMRGKKEESWRSFKTACLKADFDTFDGFFHYAMLSLDLKKHEDALVGYQKLIELAPQRAEGYQGMLNVYLVKGEHEKALPYFKHLLTLYPESSELMLFYGQSLMACKRYPEALPLLISVLKKNPGVVQGYMEVARCLYHMGRTQESMKVLKDFLAQRPPAEFATPVEKMLQQLQTGKLT